MQYWKGALVRLRPIVKEDADTPYYAIDEFYDYEAERLGCAISFPLSPDKMREILEREAKKMREGDDFSFVIENLTGDVVGNVSTFQCNPRMGTFRYGIDLAKSAQRKGYGSEALYLVLRYYFYELRYQKCNAAVFSFNENSIAFHEKFGFVREGVLRNMVYTKGTHYDEIWYGMTNKEFYLRYGQED